MYLKINWCRNVRKELIKNYNLWFICRFSGQETVEPSLRLQNGGFDEEYQETQRRVNYNYHPIIDFFKPEAAMLKSEEPMQTSASTIQTDHDSWKPIFKPWYQGGLPFIKCTWDVCNKKNGGKIFLCFEFHLSITRQDFQNF